MSGTAFLQDLAVVLLAAGFAALVFHRLRQPLVVGYILAGLLIGPHTPPFSFVSDEHSIRTLAELGVIFLMFSLGLEFNLRRLRRAGSPVFITALFDVIVMIWAGYHVGRALGWGLIESLFLGAIICDSSTTILAKVFQEMGRSRERFAGLVFGLTLVEDVIAVAVIAGLTGLALTGTLQAGLLISRLWTLVLFVVAVAVVGLLALPRLLNRLERSRHDELLVVTVVGLCFGVALVAVRLHLSAALGAVLVGAIASESRAAQRLATLIDPLRHIFGAVFFVSVGLLLDPALIVAHAGPILLVTATVIAGKFLTNSTGLLLTGHDLPTAIRAGAGMAQIGEFAFIIAALGISLNCIGPHVYQIGVTASVLSTLASPYLIRLSDRLAEASGRSPVCCRFGDVFRLYGQWISRVRAESQDAGRQAVRRTVWILLVNTALISAILGAAGLLSRTALAAYLPVPAPEWRAPLLWLAAMLLALPLYVATVRKLEALGMFLAEMALPMTMQAPWTRPMRSFVAHSVLVGGCVGLATLTFGLSLTLLRSTGTILTLMAALALLGFWLWRRLARLYGRAQAALREVTADPEQPAATAAAIETPPSFELQVRALVLPDGSPAAGRTLQEIQLRTHTGATVVGIERGGQQMTNPAPATRLHGGDRLLLLGSPRQIRDARRVLGSSAPSPHLA